MRKVADSWLASNPQRPQSPGPSVVPRMSSLSPQPLCCNRTISQSVYRRSWLSSQSLEDCVRRSGIPPALGSDRWTMWWWQLLCWIDVCSSCWGSFNLRGSILDESTRCKVDAQCQTLRNNKSVGIICEYLRCVCFHYGILSGCSAVRWMSEVSDMNEFNSNFTQLVE